MHKYLSAMSRKLRWIWASAAVVALGACSQPQVVAPTPQPRPTVTAPTPTAESALPLDIAALQQYTHASGLFALAIPQGWQASDHSRAGELITQFTDQNENAVIVSNVLTITEQLSAAMLSTTLEQELIATYGQQPGFGQAASRQIAGGQLILWHYQAATAAHGGKIMQGQSVIRQIGHHVGLITIVAPGEQAQQVQPIIAAVLDSYTLGGAERLPLPVGSSALAPVSIAPLQPYSHASQHFSACRTSELADQRPKYG